MKKHIFIIDDDPISIIILKKNLELIAISEEIVTFSNGKDAFNHLEKEYLKNEQYVIFLDINMPEMNGWEFLNKVEHLITSQNTSIYLLTSSINKADMEKAKQFLLIEKYLSKPICKEVLIEIKEKNKL
ncbi:response regulator receiver domain-containing protein [Flavobacterium aquaticum]|jgi:CheY-like chemotaxis protein|uniref:Response regulator receiver domain-containing protein n=1 Tax=Flavobacterium aquaticum TaxID=1236486 RepID=A0A327YQ41_9FLAO|nr:MULTISPECIES: response regulator [Flavobacterium]MCK6607190.1 response regulator [Flavobacterium sp.]RAK22682.1 response regulator receiver domain-containing protein [Flavobacterium aquaticum]